MARLPVLGSAETCVRVVSVDFDGCLFNVSYINSENKDILASNHAFLDKLVAENKFFSKTILFIGSKRQSHLMDVINASFAEKGSCFPRAIEVARYLKAQLDTFLLADLYGDLPSGASFERTMNDAYTGKHADWVVDQSKLSVLYAQMHRAAVRDPDAEIDFVFFDDEKGIL